MPELNGFDVLASLKVDRFPVVVFVTAYDEYAVRAFDVNAVDYLLKPFDRTRFQRAVDRAKTQVRHGHDNRIEDKILALLEKTPSPRYLERLSIRSVGSIVFLKTDDVDWMKAEGNYVRLHVGKTSHLLRTTIRNLEESLDPAKFARIHRSQIVNIDRIRELKPWWHGEYHVLLKDGTTLTLSRTYRDRLCL